MELFEDTEAMQTAPYLAERGSLAGLRKRKSLVEVRKPNVPVSVLVVDDDLVFCMIMQALGRKIGVEVVTVTGPDKLMRYLDCHFDVAIVDVNLNLRSGIAMIARLSSFFRNTPVVLVSDSFFSKPVRATNIIREFVAKASGPHAILDAALENWEMYGRQAVA